ncbi:PHB depolymerase family esterase [uncultured Microscilla sp.]|uniref:PKD domain-containing protein n=1 Tax=uncultured Microscilla sp. TaxID=432653 RepID=UPI00263698D2|nr:PHB depolymerase family esterase [uncultured Microscilla sp.]
MRLIKTMLFLFLSYYGTYAQNIASNSDLTVQTIKPSSLNHSKTKGYLEYLPTGYDTESQKTYPLIIFLHGKGERGNGASDLWKVTKHGLPKKLEQGIDMCYDVQGEQKCFIVISPQLDGGASSWGAGITEYVLNYAMQNYRVDPNRVYLTGHSLGGIGVYKHAPNNLNATNKWAGIAPIAANGLNPEGGCAISSRKINVRAFHGDSDGIIGLPGGKYAFDNIVNCQNPAPVADLDFVVFENTGHNGAPAKAYDPQVKYENQNLYEWFLSHTLNEYNNQPPVIDTRDSVFVSEGSNSFSLTASNSYDPEGGSLTYAWTQTSGNLLIITGQNTATLNASGVSAGDYLFSLQVTDNGGASANKTVFVRVLGANNLINEKVEPQKNTPYLEYLPSSYRAIGTPHPVLIYLHSQAAQGTNIDLIKQEGPMYYLNQQQHNFCFDVNGTEKCFVVIAPQVTKGFYKGRINALYNHIIQNYNIDPAQVYITGFAAGGSNIYARLLDAENSPNRYAGIGIVGAKIGNANASAIAALGATIWIGHSQNDEVSPYAPVQAFADQLALENTAGNTKFVSYESFTNQASAATAFNPSEAQSMYAWLLNPSTQMRKRQLPLSPTHKDIVISTGKITFDKATQNTEVKMYSATGRAISTAKVQRFLAYPASLENGVYVYKIIENGALVQEGRILKMD